MKIYDVIGVGVGPFNLGLAALLDPVTEIEALFFEQKPQFEWHEGMLIEGTTLQVPFLADVVTMADPTSPFSYLNYLKVHQRLYHFYFLEQFLVPRKEYNHYGQWVSSQLDSLLFHHRVENTQFIQEGNDQYYKVEVREQNSNKVKSYYAKHLVLGIGSEPYVLDTLDQHSNEDVFHSALFLQRQERVKRAESITVIGSGQSAAEVFYELLKEQLEYGYELNWYTRSRGFFPMEYSKLGLEHFSPDYIQYFYQLPQSKRDQILPKQDLLYKGISAKTIADIHEQLYHLSIGNREIPVNLLALTELQQAEVMNQNGRVKYKLHLQQIEEDASFTAESEVVIAATGYKHPIPSFISDIRSHITWDEQGRYIVGEDYKLQLTNQTERHIFVQNGEVHTHGIGAPDLGLGAHRNSVIINSLTGREVYPIQKKNVFQQFGINKNNRRGVNK
ncbi:lysine N(6)-hydroxylase/L-ornithine N(5)-oxygenase family protein [Chengkuizengella sediminis]|uniref:lysine N(6)-hydroxylase/L-ornithine N(5)-oxygenase family protein n=1 Tax=Chengkuizengella sediminis TaxID=1885917 RepID=UPI00138A19DE|nr:lysine N(6)-hydroxylase/L-ornithine N(5)-oxygenase family protein [Chengkuizengella sediminis]NDI36045.1 lysine N(6)-hydroxylase/L-ornithine N(5)-oxygenase family protein [Chengkuizengella sediminis]